MSSDTVAAFREALSQCDSVEEAQQEYRRLLDSGARGWPVSMQEELADAFSAAIQRLSRPSLDSTKSDKTTLYAIVEVGWEYNDEYYYRAGNGDIRRVFRSKEKAERELAAMNEAWRKEEAPDMCFDVEYDEDEESEDGEEKVPDSVNGYELVEVEADL